MFLSVKCVRAYLLDDIPLQVDRDHRPLQGFILKRMPPMIEGRDVVELSGALFERTVLKFQKRQFKLRNNQFKKKLEKNLYIHDFERINYHLTKIVALRAVKEPYVKPRIDAIAIHKFRVSRKKI